MEALVNGSAAEAKKLLAPILSVGKPKVSAQVGNWGDIYAGFQIPTQEDPANWKFFLQFITEPFPPKAISLIRSFMQNAPTDDSNYFTNAFGGAVKTSQPRGGTAFVHRDALYYAEPGAGWGTRGRPRGGDAITPQGPGLDRRVQPGAPALRERRLCQRTEHRDGGLANRLLGIQLRPAAQGQGEVRPL
jgi:hypothetical protein